MLYVLIWTKVKLMHAIFIVICSHTFSEFLLSAQAGYVGQIPELTGNNYTAWRKLLKLAFLMLGMEYVMTTERPVDPEAPVREANETDAAWKAREDAHIKAESEHQLAKARWDLDNKRRLAIIQTKMTEEIKVSIPEKDKDGKLLTTSEYLEIVDKQHSHHTKTYASTTIGSLVAMKYTGGGI
jgi:hypothetical protein